MLSSRPRPPCGASGPSPRAGIRSPRLTAGPWSCRSRNSPQARRTSCSCAGRPEPERLLPRVQLPAARPDRLPVLPDDPGCEVKGLTRLRQRSTGVPAGDEGRSWSIASSTWGFSYLSGDTPPRHQTVTNPSNPGWNRFTVPDPLEPKSQRCEATYTRRRQWGWGSAQGSCSRLLRATDIGAEAPKARPEMASVDRDTGLALRKASCAGAL